MRYIQRARFSGYTSYTFISSDFTLSWQALAFAAMERAQSCADPLEAAEAEEGGGKSAAAQLDEAMGTLAEDLDGRPDEDEPDVPPPSTPPRVSLLYSPDLSRVERTPFFFIASVFFHKYRRFIASVFFINTGADGRALGAALIALF